MWDMALVVISVGAALWLNSSGLNGKFISMLAGYKWFGIFIAGIFLPLVFTAAPVTVFFLEIFKNTPVLPVVLIGSVGAFFGDFVIFRFAKNRVAEDLNYIINLKKHQRLAHIFHLKLFRYMTPLLGAIIIATPLPDEFGVAILGLAKITGARFAVLTFLIHAAALMFISLFS